MVYIRFNDSETVYQCTEINRMTDTLTALTFQDTAITNTSGFKWARYPDMEVINGDYSEFKTIFNVMGLVVFYSSDESRYIYVPEQIVNVSVGSTHQLISDSYGAITWVSSKPSVATISDSGLITGISAGSSIVTASCGPNKILCFVIVE